jgi:8-oxo-dGTP pyrophosphatase MutT (NUDIX family)
VTKSDDGRHPQGTPLGGRKCVALGHQIDDGLGEQIAALPLVETKKGKLNVLMVTSRGTKRWVMPKGWQMDGKKPWQAAEIEALEEAGAVGYISKKPIGVYHYDKWISKKSSVACEVTVYPMIVEKLKSKWKERHERKRRWFSPKAAARRVDEPELAKLLMEISKNPDRIPALRKLLKA